MKYKKESLEKLLVLIDEICKEEENGWFIDNLNQKFSKVSEQRSFPEFFKLLKKQHKLKAQTFYKTIENEKLRKELIADFILMSQYQAVNDIPKFMLHVFYQLENILNFYAIKSNSFTKINGNKNYYQKAIGPKFEVVCFDGFFNINGAKEISKISIWHKLVYWVLDSGEENFFNNNKTSFSNLINLRNKYAHRNSTSDYSTENMIFLNKLIGNLSTGDFNNLSFFISILRTVSNSISKISQEVIYKEVIKQEQSSGLKIIGKVDLDKLK